jgi:hypothetical protein
MFQHAQKARASMLQTFGSRTRTRVLSQTGVHRANQKLNGFSRKALICCVAKKKKIRWLTTEPPCASTSHVPDIGSPSLFEIKKRQGSRSSKRTTSQPAHLPLSKKKAWSRRIPEWFWADWFCYQQAVHALHHRKRKSQMRLCARPQSRLLRTDEKLLNSIPTTKPVQRTSMARVQEKLASSKPTRQTKVKTFASFQLQTCEVSSHLFRLCVWYWVLSGRGVTISTLGVRIGVHYIALRANTHQTSKTFTSSGHVYGIGCFLVVVWLFPHQVCRPVSTIYLMGLKV